MPLTMSEQPRKQRKARYTAPMHLRQRLVHAHLSKEAKERLKTRRRAVAVREGDKVKIMRGKFRGHSGKVSEVDLKSSKIYVEGAVARKAKGAEVLVAIEPSNVMIMELDMSDKKRKEKFGQTAEAAPAGEAKTG